jgi:hypothetical protein
MPVADARVARMQMTRSKALVAAAVFSWVFLLSRFLWVSTKLINARAK